VGNNYRKMSMTKYYILTLIGVLFGLYLRMNVAYTTDFWLNETLSIVASKHASYINLLLQNNDYWDFSHPSLYYVILKIWMSAFPFTEAWIRNLSLMFFLPSSLLVYLIAKRMHKNAGYVAVIWCSGNPLFVGLGYQARMYAMAIFI
jgi:uncharacterized membrane protein